LMFMLNRLEWIPRSTPMINWFVLAALLGAPRFLYRQFKDRRASNKVRGQETSPKIPVLLVGAADGAEMFIRTIGRNPASAYRIVGIVGENAGRVGRNIHGVHVLGTIDDVPSVYKQLASEGKTPQRIIVTKDDVEKSSMQKLIGHADTLGVSFKVISTKIHLFGQSPSRTCWAEHRMFSTERVCSPWFRVGASWSLGPAAP